MKLYRIRSYQSYRIFNCFTKEIYCTIGIVSNDTDDLIYQLNEIKSRYADSGYQLIEY